MNSVNRKCNPLRRWRAQSARNAGESAICPVCAQPSAEIVRVKRAKCRRECDLSGVRATICGDRACRAREMQARVRFVPRAICPMPAQLCGDRACQVREMQARVRFVPCARNPLRRSCVERAKCNESAFWRLAASLLEEVSYETRAKRSFWSLGAALAELDSDLASS